MDCEPIELRVQLMLALPSPVALPSVTLYDTVLDSDISFDCVIVDD